MSVFKHVIGSLGDLGGEILKETAKVPGEIVGVAVKSQTGEKSTEKSPGSNKWPILNAKNIEPRRMLQQFVGSSAEAKKKPTVWDEKQMEIKQQKDMKDKQDQLAQKQALPRMAARRQQGAQKYGLNTKMNPEKQRDTKAE